MACAVIFLLPASSGAATKPARVDFTGDVPAGPTEFFRHGGLRLTATCSPGPTLSVTASTLRDDALIHSNVQSVSGTGYAADEDFDVGESFDVFDGLTDAGRTGQVVYSTRRGTQVTIEAADLVFLNSSSDCTYVGSAQIATGEERAGTSRRRVDYRAGAEQHPRTFFAAQGLKLRGSCGSGGGLSVVARSSVPHAVLHANAQGVGNTATYADDNNLRPSERFSLTGNLHPGDSSAGQLIFNTPSGRTVTMQWLSKAHGVYGDHLDCAFAGSARVLGTRARDLLLFRPRHARGTRPPFPFPPFGRTFFTRRHIQLGGKCYEGPELTVQALTDVASSEAGAVQFDPGDQAASSGGGGGGPGGFGIALASDRAAGHTVVRLSGDILTLDWLAEEKNAYGRRRPCLFAGSAEYLKP